MMTKVEVTKVEEQRNGRFLFSVRAVTSEGRIEFPMGIHDLGSPALDEIAVLRSTLGIADDPRGVDPTAPGTANARSVAPTQRFPSLVDAMSF